MKDTDNIPRNDRPTIAIYGALQFAFDYFNKALFEGKLPNCIIAFHRQRRVMGYASFRRWKNAQGERVDELAINPEYFEDYPIIEIFQTLCHEMCHLWQSHFGNPGRRGYHNKEWARKMESIGLMPSETGAPGGAQTGEHMMDYVIYEGPFMENCRTLIDQKYSFPWIDCFPIMRTETPVYAYKKDNTPIELSPSLKPKKEKAQLNKGKDALISLATMDSSLMDENGLMPWDKIESSSMPVSETSRPTSKSSKIKYTCKRCRMNVWGKADLNIACLDCNLQLSPVE